MKDTKSVLNETPRTIRVSFKTYRELSQLGTFGDSFDSIIEGLLSKQKNRLEQEGRHSYEVISLDSKTPSN